MKNTANKELFVVSDYATCRAFADILEDLGFAPTIREWHDGRYCVSVPNPYYKEPRPTTFFVCFHTGAGDFQVTGALEDAMSAADEGAGYTQRDITIEDEGGNVVAVRRWYGVPYDPEETESTVDEVIQYGDFGHYEAWEVI